MLIEKLCSVNEPSAEVARTVIVRFEPTISRLIGPATVTTPVVR